MLARGEHHAENRQDGVSSGESFKDAAVALDVAAGEESAVGLPAADTAPAFSAGGVHAGDDVWRADAGLRLEYRGQAAPIDGIVATYGDYDGICAEILSSNHAE